MHIDQLLSAITASPGFASAYAADPDFALSRAGIDVAERMPLGIRDRRALSSAAASEQAAAGPMGTVSTMCPPSVLGWGCETT